MRFRNIKPKVKTVSGNLRTALTSRDVRSRLFAPMDSGPLFKTPDLGPMPSILRVEDEDGNEVPIQSRGPVEWDLEPPVQPLTDASPPAEEGPLDAQLGGADNPTLEAKPPIRQYTVVYNDEVLDTPPVSRSLDTSSPTANNCAQVLSALLLDLQRYGRIVIRLSAGD